MASLSTPSSTATPTKKHEVFLSFSGEDTRQGFTSHLYDALCRKNIETFMDDDKLRRGVEISKALSTAIEESKIAVVIFSKNYASSKWRMKSKELIVMPVFYNIDPSDVRKLNGSFKCSFANEEKEFQEEVQKWREALTQSSNQAGFDSSVIRPDAKLVGEIVKAVWRELRSKYIPSSSDFEGLIGIHKRIELVMSLLCLDMKDVLKIIGIWGMGGIGKTTIARAVFKSISYKFDGACFIEKVGKRLENDGSNRLQLEVLSEVLHGENIKLGTLTVRPFIMELLNQKKIFIILDDVNEISQLKTFVEIINQCGLGSRIIITSRDKQVLCNFKVDDREIHEEKGLDDDEAHELFRKHANPTEDCMALSDEIVYCAKGNPLALEVLGSFFKGKSKQVWESALGGGGGGGNNQPKGGGGGGGQPNPQQQLQLQLQQLQQMKGFQDLKLPAHFKDMKMPMKDPDPNQKTVKFAALSDEDDFSDYDEDDDDLYEEEYDEPLPPFNKMKPPVVMGNGGGPQGGGIPNNIMMMMNGNHPQLMNAQKTPQNGAQNGKKGGAEPVPVQVNMGNNGNGGKKEGGGGGGGGINQNLGGGKNGKNGGGGGGGLPQDGKSGGGGGGANNKNGGGGGPGDGNGNMNGNGGKKVNTGGGGMGDMSAFQNMSGPQAEAMAAAAAAAQMGQMGNGPMGQMSMGQMGRIPAVQGLPAAAMSGGPGGGGGGGSGYFQGAGPDLMPGNPYHPHPQPQQQQYMAAMMNQYYQQYQQYQPQHLYPQSDQSYTTVFSDENTSSCNVM